MIVIALGANIPSQLGEPIVTLTAAICEIDSWPDVHVCATSRFFCTAPIGLTDQPDFVNGVVSLETAIEPLDLLRRLLELERSFGRERGERWGPRTMDLDIIDYHGQIGDSEADGLQLTLPHPRAAQRAFVLMPLAEMAPDWRHPVSGKCPADLLAALPEEAKSGIFPQISGPS